MQDEGLVDFDRLEQEKLPDQKVYFVTEAGSADLDRWLREPVPIRVGRDMPLAQLWFSSRIDKEDVINNIETYADEVRNLIEWYKTEARTLVERGVHSSTNPMNELYWNVAIDGTITQMEAWLKWADYAVKQISSFESKDTKSPSVTEEIL